MIQSNMTLVYYFTADWCRSCTKFTPKWIQVMNDNSNLSFTKVDVSTQDDETKELTEQFGIEKLPTVVIVNNEEITHKLEGKDQCDTLDVILAIG